MLIDSYVQYWVEEKKKKVFLQQPETLKSKIGESKWIAGSGNSNIAGKCYQCTNFMWIKVDYTNGRVKGVAPCV